MTHEEAINIGYITKTKGLKGEVQVFFEVDFYEDIDFDVIFADINGKLVPFFVSACKLYPNSTGLFFFDDIDHIDKAEPLVRKKVYLPLSSMPERDSDDFTYEDLKGFLASDQLHGELGEITEVNAYPQQYVATVICRGKEILFPLNEEIIVEIDDVGHKLLVNLPSGLLDLYLEQ